MFLEASPSCTCKTIHCKQIFITKIKNYCKNILIKEKKTLQKIFIAKQYSLPEEFLGEKVYSLQRVSIEASLLFALAKTPNPPTA